MTIQKEQRSIIAIIMLLIVINSMTDSTFSVLLPNIQQSLNIDISLNQSLISTYFLGFAIGMLFWGQIADLLGRKLAWSLGFFVYTVSIASGAYCYNPYLFLLIRFIQGFAGSVTNVMCLIIVRDLFHDIKKRTRVHATINQSFALGPIFGYFMANLIQYMDWRHTYLTLALINVPLFILLQNINYKDQHKNNTFSYHNIIEICKTKKLQYASIISGLSIGVGICYLSEMPYILNNYFNTQSLYRITLIPLSLTWLIAANLARRLPLYFNQAKILRMGSLIIAICSSLALFVSYINLNQDLKTILYILLIMSTMLGTGISIPSAIGLGLENFGNKTGTAAAVLGCSYYLIAMLVQRLLVALPHSLATLPMLFIAISMIISILIKKITK